MTFGKKQLFSKFDYEETRIIIAGIPILLDELVAQDRDTIVLADEVVVSKLARTAGHNLTIACRSLRFDEGARIVASGAKGDPDMPGGLPPELPREPGLAGLDGRDGGAGKASGSVRVFVQKIVGLAAIEACGGDGGRGGDGGNGSAGAGGAGGARVRESKDNSRANGSKGGRGGNAGLPGRRGTGGKGGGVVIALIEVDRFDPRAIKVSGGLAAEPATPGRPGTGGPGGEAGFIEWFECEGGPGGPGGRGWAVGDDMSYSAFGSGAFFAEAIVLEDFDLGRLENVRIGSLLNARAMLGGDYRTLGCHKAGEYRGNPGPQGETGDDRASEVAERQAEPPREDGKVDVHLASYAELAAQFTDAALELICMAVEDAYRSSSGSSLGAISPRINLLLELCLATPDLSEARRAILARSYAMARKIALGLDFYGYSKEFAPLISFEGYARLLKDYVLDPAIAIESSFNSYWEHSENTEAMRAEMRRAVTHAERQLAALTSDGARFEADARTKLASLAGLDSKVDAAFAILMAREAELTSAIRKKHGRCDLLNTLVAVGTIVVGVATGGSALIAAASAGAKLYEDYSANNESFNQLWDNRKIIQDDLTEIGDKASDVVSAVEAIQKGVAKLSPEERRLPQFRMERDYFDKIASDFINIPEAQAYREAGHNYLKAVETRNQAIVDYNALLVQIVEQQARVASAAGCRDILQSSLSGALDPAEPVIMATMSRLYFDTLALAAQLVHSEKKALAYHFGRPAFATISALNMSTILSEHIQVAGRQWEEAKSRYAARRELSAGLLELDLRDFVDKQSWVDFKRNGILSLTIRRDQTKHSVILSSLPGLRLTGMLIELPGAKVAAGQTQIPWTMVHLGSELIYDGDGAAVAFSHRPVRFRGFTPITGQGSLLASDFTEKDLYAGLSPFASWLLDLKAPDVLGLDLAGVKSAKLRLSGYIIDG